MKNAEIIIQQEQLQAFSRDLLEAGGFQADEADEIAHSLVLSN